MRNRAELTVAQVADDVGEESEQSLMSDITYLLWARQGWMLLAVVIDLFSRRIVG